MKGSGVARHKLRFVLGAAALAAGATLAASCVEAIDLEGYQDSVALVCDLMDRCYSVDPEICSTHLGYHLYDGAHLFLKNLQEHNCLNSCSELHRCVGASPVCFETGITFLASQDGCQ